MSIGKESTDQGHVCQPCQRHFPHAQALRMHREMSKEHRGTNSSPSKSVNSEYKCELCTKTFKSRNALDHHILDSASHKTTSPTANTSHAKSSEASKSAIQNTNGTKAKTANGAVHPTTTSNHEKHSTAPLPKVWGNWSAIPVAERDTLMDALRAECHSTEFLCKQGFWTQIPSAKDLDLKKKCKNCGEMKKKLRSSTCRFHPAKKAFEKGIMQGRGTNATARKAPCVKCNQIGNYGCIALTTHDFALADPKLTHMQISPSPSPKSKSNRNARKAVVLDCEMVGVLGPNNGQVSEAIRVSAVDFLSGEVLVDTYVEPAERIIAWRSQYSGVTPALFKDMKRRGRTVRGWRAARELVWKYIDQDTVLMGHALHNDLAVLGIVHGNVVDSAILTRDAVGCGCRRSWALRALTLEFLSREIQTGSSGHDCLEDTFAAREVVLWCLRNKDGLEEWASCHREEWSIVDGINELDLNKGSDEEVDTQDCL